MESGGCAASGMVVWWSYTRAVCFFFFFSSRRRHTRLQGDWSSDVCSSDLARRGVFGVTRRAGVAGDEAEEELRRLHAAQAYAAFLRLAVRARKNVVVSGATGSGKTTWTKALIREIPRDERLITIEDARELVLDDHPNHVRLFYSKDDQGLARVTPKQLLECCLRMRPDRILLAELRSEEAFDYLRNVNSRSEEHTSELQSP